MRARIMPVLLVGLFLSGCAHVMSEESLRLVDYRITFADLKRSPETFIGKYVLLGGTIAGVKNKKGGGELEVLQAPLDSSDKPEETHYSGGRFLVDSPDFLDPLVYKTGRRITVVGEVKGKKTRTIDEVEYIYPLVAAVEIHLFERYEADRFYYYPYPPPFYYDPFWDPWWPYYRRPFYPHRP
jgi:outer membrane lipoprotein